MNFVNKIYELAEQIAYRHKMLNHHAAWLLLSTIAVWSLSDNHPIPAIVAAILIMGFYAVIIMNDVKTKYGDKLIADGRKVSILELSNQVQRFFEVNFIRCFPT